MNNISLTAQAHLSIKQSVNPGDIVIDATVGNGHDTYFLARLVGRQGRVFGFDCQLQAIDTTQKRLVNNEVFENTQLFHSSHSQMIELIPSLYTGKINAIMFNLGYLPGSDKTIITKANSTLTALNQAIKLLAATGTITVVAYPGHPGGDTETHQIKQWCRQVASQNHSIQILYSSEKINAPVLFVIKKAPYTP